jgi:hypothetical protein
MLVHEPGVGSPNGELLEKRNHRMPDYEQSPIYLFGTPLAILVVLLILASVA